MSTPGRVTGPANRAGMDGLPKLAERAGRILALLLVLFTFLRAGTAVPCDAHRYDGGSQHHGARSAQAAQSAGTHGHDDHHGGNGGGTPGGCQCLGACHPASTPALPGTPCSPPVATVALHPATDGLEGEPAVARSNLAYVLPYATAPPQRVA